MNKKVALLGSLLLFACMSCSSVTTNYDFDPSVNFTEVKTFSIYQGESIPGDVLAAHPLVKKRVEDAIVRGLKEKGLTHIDNDETDVVIVVHAGTQDKIQVTDYGHYGWYDPWWGPYGGHVDVSHYTEGTLVIDIVEYKTKELVWRGLGTKVVHDYSNPEKMQREIDKYVFEILRNYPPPGRK